MSLLGCGCSAGAIDQGATFGTPNTVPEDDGPGSTGGTVLTTGVTENPPDPSASTDPTDGETSGADPGTSDTDSDTETTAGSSSETSAGVSDDSTGALAECGNGVIEDDEACDGDELDDMTCADIGTFVGGVLACDVACAFDTAGCMEPPKAPVEVCETINLAIPDAAGTVSSTVTLPDGGTVADAVVRVALTHTYIGDLTVDVAHGGTTVRVFDRECGTEEDIDLSFDDAGAALNCAASTSGTATLPAEALSSFDGAAAGGGWTFSFQDNAAADTGAVTEICVSVSF